MKSIAKLKDRARKHEQQEDWQAAIEAYQQVIEAEEGEDELELELPLYNRIGDLYLRLGQTDNAVKFYERAADKYAEAGFFNNAIALCNKALRHRPGRTQVYLKLSRLSAEQGFDTDARRWIIDYAEREAKAGHLDAALAGLETFVESTDDPDVRELLAGQLAKHGRTDDALDQLRRAYQRRVAAGNAEIAQRLARQAKSIDPSVDLESETPLPPAGAGAAEPGGGLEGLEPGAAGGAGIAGLEGLETRPDEPAPAAEPDDAELPGLEVSYSERGPAADPAEAGGDTLGGLETFGTVELEGADAATGGAGVGPDAGLEPEAEEEEPEPLPFMDTGLDDEAEEDPTPLPLLDEADEADEAPEPAEPIAELEPEWEEPEEEPVEEPEEEPEEEPVEEPVAALEPEWEPDTEEEEEEEPEETPVAALEPEWEEPAEEPVAALEPEWVPDAAAEEEEEEEEVVEAEEEEAADGFPLMDLGGAGEAADAPGDAATLDVPGLELSFETPGATGGGAGTEPWEMDALEPGAGGAVNADAVLQRARELVGRGLWAEAVRELELLSGDDHGAKVFGQAVAVLQEVARHEPDHLPALQQRVDFAARTGDASLLAAAYADLAGALARHGDAAKAGAVYQRLLEIDPEHPDALAAVGDADAAPAGARGPVDLGAILDGLEPEEAAGLEEAMASGQADPAFEAMLSQFKARVSEQSPVEDPGDHYDLGLAFREMGLIDEAIAEFQTALRAGEERLKVYEELGRCYVLKGQYNVAVQVFNRALQVPFNDEAELLGVYYHLGQSYEELGQRAEARKAYSRVLAIDGSFADVPDRMARL